MMKINFTAYLVFAFFNLFSQETIIKTISHDGLERSYIVYTPAVYDGSESVPLVLNFHGYGQQAADQMLYGDFRYIADTANFIIVHPQGTVHDENTHWNVGGWIINSPADDVDFVKSLLVEVENDYNINEDRIYATGMSNGGFFSFLLACELSNKIAAIASVTGSMTPNNFSSCSPERPISVMQIHGTDDPLVTYTGEVWTKPIPEVINYWIEHNECEEQAITFDLPDITITDGSTVTFSRYDNGNNGSVVEHLRVNGGRHTWPGTIFNTIGTNYDFLASDAIWKFFTRYDLNGSITTSTVENQNFDNIKFSYTPSTRSISTNRDRIDYSLLTLNGRLVKRGTTDSKEIDVTNLTNGVYFLLHKGRSYKLAIY